MKKVVVITGGSAGVGRAAAELFARNGYDVGVMARGTERLDQTAAELRGFGARVCAVTADVANAAEVEAAAERIERELGPVDIWVNNAMATVFAPVSQLQPEEVERGTRVTYLGQVHGTMAALRRMRQRNAGVIVNIGSALSYRAIPLQAVYCAAKYAVRGFTDSLRAEIIHDGLDIHLTMVHLPAMNTPQFDWALDKMDRLPQPVPPIFQPEVAAKAILFAATHRRREIWVGLPTVKAILANKFFPGLLDHYLAKYGYDSQLAPEPNRRSHPGNLFEPVAGDWGAHGRFDASAQDYSLEMWTSRHRGVLAASVLALLGFAASLAAARVSRQARNSLRRF